MDIPSALEELTSIDHRATALLRREHEAILGAFREYRDASRGTRETIGQQIAVLIEIHDRVERAVVYPALAPYYGPLIRAFLAEHDEISSCIAVIRDTRNSAADALAPELVLNDSHDPLSQSLSALHSEQFDFLPHPKIDRHDATVTTIRPFMIHFRIVTPPKL